MKLVHKTQVLVAQASKLRCAESADVLPQPMHRALRGRI